MKQIKINTKSPPNPTPFPQLTFDHPCIPSFVRVSSKSIKYFCTVVTSSFEVFFGNIKILEGLCLAS